MPLETISTLFGLLIAYATRRKYLSDSYGAVRTLASFLLVWFVSAAVVYIALIAGLVLLRWLSNWSKQPPSDI